MNTTLLNAARLLLGIICIGIGIDKFFNFLSVCSLMGNIPDEIAIATGIIEIIVGVLIILKIQLIPALYFTAIFMAMGVLFHLVNNTYDISGALLLAIYALGLIYFQKPLIKNRI